MKIQTNVKAGAMCVCNLDSCGGDSYVKGSSGDKVFVSDRDLSNYLDSTALNTYDTIGRGTSSVVGWGCYS